MAVWEIRARRDEQRLSRRAVPWPQMFPSFTGECGIKQHTADCFPSHTEVFHLKRQDNFSAAVEFLYSEPYWNTTAKLGSLAFHRKQFGEKSTLHHFPSRNKRIRIRALSRIVALSCIRSKLQLSVQFIPQINFPHFHWMNNNNNKKNPVRWLPS